MEVHHHPDLHHKEKNFKEYFLEFLMIFLAVTMGFFAESIRERISDNSKEKEYIISMLEDVQTDTANIHNAIALNKKRVLALDTLATLCFNYDASKSNDPDIYRLYRQALVHPDFISLTERTLSQLKNSGAMRLIRKKEVIDSIVLYDDLAKKLIDQQGYYELYQNKTVETSFKIFNFGYYNFGYKKGVSEAHKYDAAKLISTDKLLFIEFGNCISVYKGVVRFYTDRLEETDEHANYLITTIKSQYHLKDE